MSEDTEVEPLTGWLLERIAEDEAAAGRHFQAAERVGLGSYTARVLAECAAKRAIVEQCASALEEEWHTGYTCGAENGYDRIIRALATVYADRPGFREEWA